jgi:hypothetical protein
MLFAYIRRLISKIICMTRFTKTLLFLLLTITGPALYAQEPADTVKRSSGAQYFFKAMSFSTQSAGTRALTPGEFDVRVTPDSVIASLPYYGRYFAGTQTASGIQFRSGNFEYKVEQKKKGKVYITIIPKDIRDVRELFLTIFGDGTALLQINSPNRELMSFNGYLTTK